MIASVLVLCFSLLVILAALKDLTSYTIPNWISLALIALFLAAAPFLWLGWTWFGLHLLTFFAALVLVMGMFAAGWIGGGDAKLFAAIALWMGWPDVFAFALVAALVGGAMTLALLMGRRVWTPGVAPEWADALMSPEGDVPYGVALAAGALLTFPGSAVAAAAFGG